MIRLQTDGAFAPDGLAGAGIIWQKGRDTKQLSRVISAPDNHAAEFAAARIGFQILNDNGQTDDIIQFTTDSKAVVAALTKRYSHGYADDLAALLALTDRFKLVLPQWVPEKETHQAHALAQQALARQRR